MDAESCRYLGRCYKGNCFRYTWREWCQSFKWWCSVSLISMFQETILCFQPKISSLNSISIWNTEVLEEQQKFESVLKKLNKCEKELILKQQISFKTASQFLERSNCLWKSIAVFEFFFFLRIISQFLCINKWLAVIEAVIT